MTQRDLLAAEIAPGTRYRMNLAIDGNGLPQILRIEGLFTLSSSVSLTSALSKACPKACRD